MKIIHDTHNFKAKERYRKKGYNHSNQSSKTISKHSKLKHKAKMKTCEGSCEERMREKGLCAPTVRQEANHEMAKVRVMKKYPS
jgi:hypothetical protein